MDKMTPQEYVIRTGASYSDIAAMCFRDYATVAKWFSQGKSKRNPTLRDCEILRLNYQLKITNASS